MEPPLSVCGTGEGARKELDAERARLAAKRKRVVDAVAEGLMSAPDAKPTLDELNASLDAVAVPAQQLAFAGENRRALAA